MEINHTKTTRIKKLLNTLTAIFLTVIVILSLGPLPAAEARSSGKVLPLVPKIDAKDVDRSLFAPEEQVFGRYLLILPELANSVVDDREAEYGWMEDGWWRDVNEPQNKRIMEQVYTLSWFYGNERDWNPYSGNAALLGRLDAALGYYLKGQLSNGAITHNGKAHLASTGFGVLALAETLDELKKANVLPQRQAELEIAIRKGSEWLTNKNLNHWKPPLKYFNQLVAGLVAVEKSSRILKDPSIAASVNDLTGYLLQEGVSPAGYFNEPLSLDAGYNWTVALPDIADLYEETHDERLIELARKFVENFRYTTVLEPGNDLYFTHFTSASARTESLVFAANVGDERDALAAKILEEIPEAAPFFPSEEAKAFARKAWGESESLLTPLRKGATSPRNLMHIPKSPLGAPEEIREEQIKTLPYLQKDSFTEIRKGTIDQDLLLVKRPTYYSGSVIGEREKGTRTKIGTGFLWNPDYGIVLLGLNRYADEGTDIGWTTVQGNTLASQASTTYGYRKNDKVIASEKLSEETDDFISWYDTVDGKFQTEVAYQDNGIVKKVKASGEAEEILPLTLSATDQIIFNNGLSVQGDVKNISTQSSGFTLIRDEMEIKFSWAKELPISMELDKSVLFNGTAQKKLVNPMRISFSDEFEIAIQFPNVSSEEPPVTQPEPPTENPIPTDPSVDQPSDPGLPEEPEEPAVDPEPTPEPIPTTPSEETPTPVLTTPSPAVEEEGEYLVQDPLSNDTTETAEASQSESLTSKNLAQTGNSMGTYLVVLGAGISLILFGGVFWLLGRRRRI